MLIGSGDQVVTYVSEKHFLSKPLQQQSHLLIYIYLQVDRLLFYFFGKKKMKRKYKQKQTFAEALLRQKLKYFLLYDADSLYPQRLSLLRSSDFKASIRKAARQLSPLLSVNDSQFFKLLAQNDSIRTSLESCLSSFPRRIYGRFSDAREKRDNKANLKDQSFKIYAFLMKIVLFIFYRISKANTKQDKELVYDQFLLDIPKLLDIAAIYGQSNPEIVKKLIANAYEMHPSYDNDTMDFFNDVQNGKFSQMEKNRSTLIDFSPESLSAENYGNREKYMIETTMLTLFTVKDILFNLTNFIRFFPKKYVHEFATDYKLQQKLVDGVTFFMNQTENSWNLGDYKQRYFSMHFEDFRQSMASYFIEQFKLLKEIINGGGRQPTQIQQYAHNTYETFCLMLKFKQKPYHLQYVKLINNLIEQSQDIIFFLNGTRVLNSINKTKVAVQFCQEYQKQYRRKYKLARSVDFDPILNKNRDNLKKFKEIWMSPQEKTRNAIAKQRQQKATKMHDHQLNSFISNLKYGGKSKEYDDEPEQQEFNRVQLPNQYGKVQKSMQNLSFSIDSKKKRFVPKQSINPNQLNLSFRFAEKKENISSLSFAQVKQLPETEDSDMSIIVPKPQQLIFDELDISKIENNVDLEPEQDDFKLNIEDDEFNRFIWDNEDATLQQFDKLIENSNNQQANISQNLSF